MAGTQKISQTSAKDSEKALMALLSNEGKSIPEIALMLKRNQHTIRDWLKRYKTQGIKGMFKTVGVLGRRLQIIASQKNSSVNNKGRNIFSHPEASRRYLLKNPLV